MKHSNKKNRAHETMKQCYALFLALILVLSLFACAQENVTDKGIVADWKDMGTVDPEKGTVYFGAVKGDYANPAGGSEQLYCYRFDGVRSASAGASETHEGERILLAFQVNPLTDPTRTPHPVDSEEHFRYLKAVIGALGKDGTDTDAACAYTLTVEENGKETAVYSFRSDKTVEIKRDGTTLYASVDEETFAHVAMLCALYVPYGTYGNALLLRGTNYAELSAAQDYQLQITSGGSVKQLDAEAAAAFAKQFFGDGSRATVFAPMINVKYDFENGDGIVFRETYQLNGTEYENRFYLTQDGRIYNVTQNDLSSQMIYLNENTDYIRFTGSALRVNRSQNTYDYAAVKALIEG